MAEYNLPTIKIVGYVYNISLHTCIKAANWPTF